MWLDKSEIALFISGLAIFDQWGGAKMGLFASDPGRELHADQEVISIVQPSLSWVLSGDVAVVAVLYLNSAKRGIIEALSALRWTFLELNSVIIVKDSKQLKRNSGTPTDRVQVKAPEVICLYREEYHDETLAFLDEFDTYVFNDLLYVELDFSEVREITAAAALVLFAKITRCQSCLPVGAFRFPDQVISIVPPKLKSTKAKFVATGLWAAIKPGGQKKLERLWGDWNNPYKTGNDPSRQFEDVIGHLKQGFGVLPKRIVGALQESYLNIAHHAYEAFKEDPGFNEFMVGRWWQYANISPITGKMAIIIYDMGAGIPATIRSIQGGVSDCSCIQYAMRPGVTRFNVQGRGKGFSDIKRPIDSNASAEYLLVYSGKGEVVYKSGQILKEYTHTHSMGGTLLEWAFTGVGS